MRFCLLLSFLLPILAWSASGAPAPDGVPKTPDKSRYQLLRTKSPFSLASTAAATPPPQPSFAANWFVSGIGHIGESDFVVIKSRDLSTQFSLFADESDPTTGVTLASVSWSEIAGKSTVILRKGTETALLEFNEAELRMAPAAAPASPGGAKPPPNAGVALVPNGTRAPLTNGANRLPNSAHRVAGIQPPR